MTEASETTKVMELRAALAQRVAHASEEPFVTMLWALNALQTGRAEHALPFFNAIPEGAATEGILGPHAIYPWELETLANELFVTPKDDPYRIFDCRNWSSITDIVNVLRHLEGAEYTARRGELHILNELGRISARQFEWQRGFTTTAEFYRSSTIYGQGDCARYFEEAHGMTVADMTFVGYALMAAYLETPVLRPASDLVVLHDLGVARETLGRVVARLARPWLEIASEAAILRVGGEAVAYRPSILRRYPCVLFGPGGRRMRAPLPDLIVSRVTSGLFYDVVGGGGPVRADYGRRLEHYVHRLLETMLPGISFSREWRYRAGGASFDTPDIIGSCSHDAIRLVIECKATRMGMGARFGENPGDERGYEEMAKGVAQVWRFYSHCRRGLAGPQPSPDAVGLILSLDDWFMARGTMAEHVLQRADSLASAMDAEITAADRRPVGFTSITELETVLRTATPDSFLSAVDLAASAERRGWMLTSLHQEVASDKVERRPYPFDEELKELLPWWGIVSEGLEDGI